MKKMLVTGLICGMTASTSFAVAQATDPAPAEPPPAGAAAAAPVATPAVPPPAAADVKTIKGPTDPGGRVRWGASLGFGLHVPPMFLINGEGRIGYQISNLLGVYGAIGSTAGVRYLANAGSPGHSAISYLIVGYFGAIAEAMFGDLFYVGGGPMFARGYYHGFSVGESSTGVAETRSVTSAGNKFGFDIRFGLGFGKPSGKSKRRGGFNLGIDTLILFHPNAFTAITSADGQITETGVSVGFAPTLTLGYDSR